MAQNLKTNRNAYFYHVVNTKTVKGFQNLYFFFKTLFCIGVEPINNAAIVPGEEGRSSAIHIQVPAVPQTPLPQKLYGDSG